MHDFQEVVTETAITVTFIFDIHRNTIKTLTVYLTKIALSITDFYLQPGI